MVNWACATGMDFYYDTEMIEKATVGTAGHKRWTYGMSEWGLTLYSLTVIVPTPTMYTVFDSLLESLRKIGLDIELIFEDSVGNLKVLSGRCMIPRTAISASENGFSSDTIELKGDGTFTIGTTLSTPGPSLTTDVKVINYTSASGGENTLTFPATIGKEILYVARDGVGKEVITVGTPNDKQVKWNSGSGEFTLPYDMQQGEWLYIEYQ